MRRALALLLLVVPLAASRPAARAAAGPGAGLVSIVVRDGRVAGGIKRVTLKKGQVVRLDCRGDIQEVVSPESLETSDKTVATVLHVEVLEQA